MNEPQQFLYVLKPTRLAMLTEGPTAEETAAVGRHVEYLSGHAAAGRALLFGRTQIADERTMGLVILAVGSEHEAQGIMAADPAVVAGVMRAELFPYAVAGGALWTGDASDRTP